MKYKTLNIKILKRRRKIRARVCSSLFSRLIGLMFTRKSRAKPLLFIFQKEQKIGLHMLFVFFPIYAIWLNKKMNIVAIQRLKPWTFSKIHKANYVLEVPEVHK